VEDTDNGILLRPVKPLLFAKTTLEAARHSCHNAQVLLRKGFHTP
jgi:hypothetical protein